MPASNDLEYNLNLNLAAYMFPPVQRGTRYVMAFLTTGEILLDAVVAATPTRVFRYNDVRLKFEVEMNGDWDGSRDSYVFKPAPVEKRDSPWIEVDTSIPAH